MAMLLQELWLDRMRVDEMISTWQIANIFLSLSYLNWNDRLFLFPRICRYMMWSGTNYGIAIGFMEMVGICK